MSNSSTDEPAGVLKVGQVGIATLRVQRLDIDQLAQEIQNRVQSAPGLFERMGLIVDFSALPQLPAMTTAKNLFRRLRKAGMLPVALAQRSPETERLAAKLNAPILTPFRALAQSAPPAAKEPEAPLTFMPGRIQFGAVRSGQQIYAPNRDLSILGTVGAAAEVIADGNIHVYGALRGRALAGAHGQIEARIFCSRFHAELVAIAGHHQALDDIPGHLRGQPVQIWLENEQINMAVMD